MFAHMTADMRRVPSPHGGLDLIESQAVVRGFGLMWTR